MKKKKGVVVFLVMIIAMLLLGYYSYGIVKGTAAKDNEKGIKLGLDLAGGVSITYQVKGDETPSAEDMSDTVYKLQKRVETYSTEAEVYQVGDNRISVEIPGVSDANAILEELGTPGTLEFKTTEGETFMTGEMVADAQAATDTSNTSSSKYVVQLKLTSEGAEIFSEKTGEYLNKVLPIYYDGECISYPTVQSQITNGEAVISGMSSYEDAEALASQIRSGALKLELEELQSEVVGAKLGSQAIKTSIIAAIIGILIIIAFMLIAYRIPGLAASIALLIYTGIVLAILHLYHITLTLPGIAGIILSIGMAVDANVIIFARIREEIAAGHTVAQSIDTGFKKAFSAIFDGNITTLIAAAVLGLRGSGTVKGFAATLAIGIVFSMFTALVISRWLVKALYGLGFQDKKFYGEKKERKSVNFLGKRGLFFGISLAVIVAGFVGMGAHKAGNGQALNFSMEFKGGTATTVAFDKDYTIEEIDDQIVPYVEEVTGDANVQTQKVADSNSIIIKTRTLDLDEREQLATAMEDNFGVQESDITSTNISSTISSEMRSDAIVAVIIATICMLVYIWFRFKDIRFASSAVIALVHDVLVVLAFYALSQTSVGSTFIACMLTLVGYSINATIVIFDRIRENMALESGRRDTDLKEIVNKSITQTLSRSINTSLTTFIMVFMLFILGVSSIREFAGPLMVGVICGGYSSVCITGALWYVFKTRFSKKKK
ncbi:protein translocase subunit SecD [uncultured Eubacterium sp.]|uniref:protein translocase subunit SecD n=1 Tax=uncultured Eubacterium sp. TaxID=165185 RepID=UPI0025D4D47A|nr:protein translocase subunit SecD [uncultured Eubacterium sp.]MCI6537577.1 protein translocase subunit SecD [Lachnospiraceae bacterium]